MSTKSRRSYSLLALALIGAILLAACGQQAVPEGVSTPEVEETGTMPPMETALATETAPPMETVPATETASAMKAAPAWMAIELTDVATGERFKLEDFRGKPVLLESFAVWCPTCLSQQKEMDKLREAEGDAIAHVSLNTDPNEDETIVKRHVENRGFGWLFAVSPTELTNALVEEFGLRVVSAPSAPVVLICEDQSTRFLRSGLKSADELVSEVEKGCQ